MGETRWRYSGEEENSHGEYARTRQGMEEGKFLEADAAFVMGVYANNPPTAWPRKRLEEVPEIESTLQVHTNLVRNSSFRTFSWILSTLSVFKQALADPELDYLCALGRLRPY